MKDRLLELQCHTLEALQQIKTLQQLQELEVKIIGRKGELTEILKGLKDLSLEDKKTLGPLSNDLKNTLQEAFDKKRVDLSENQENEQLSREWCDVTYSKFSIARGGSHPITQLQRELEDIFMRLGFTIFDGQELDTEYFNFDALNIPATHPARDMQDTFFVDLPDTEDGRYVLRTHTSNLQNRVYRTFTPPFRVFIPGKVYRNEAIDASHETIFHQCEGIVVGENITIGNLKHTLNTVLNRVLQSGIKTRYRPGYFPFVEPGLELDIWNEVTQSWMEFMGCGMIHPEVLKNGGIDPDRYSGFAFGFGLTRLAMMKYGIRDIRNFLQGDQKFIEQF